MTTNQHKSKFSFAYANVRDARYKLYFTKETSAVSSDGSRLLCQSRLATKIPRACLSSTYDVIFHV